MLTHRLCIAPWCGSFVAENEEAKDWIRSRSRASNDAKDTRLAGTAAAEDGWEKAAWDLCRSSRSHSCPCRSSNGA